MRDRKSWSDRIFWLAALFLAGPALSAGQDANQIVRQAVQTELVAAVNDHSRWIFYDVDRKPNATTAQWVAETAQGNLHRVLTNRNQPTSLNTQRSAMDRFIQNQAARSKQNNNGKHDDDQSARMLKLLPEAFIWTIVDRNGQSTLLHFRPNPSFHPPTWESRVFAAMEGDMRVDNA